MNEAEQIPTTRTGHEETEIERLREEIRLLESLIAGREQPPELLATSLPVPSPDFRFLFEGLPELYVVLLSDTPRFTITAVSDALLRATKTERDKLIGQPVFEVFPDNPNDPQAMGVASLRACLDLVLRERISHALPLQRYDVQRPPSEGGGLEERYWSVQNTPALGENGEVSYIVHHTKDVTEHVRLKEREKQERAARLRAEERIGGILDGMSDAFLVLDKEWRIQFMNREAARINGKMPEAFLGKTYWEEWPAAVGTPLEAAYRRAMVEQVSVHLEHHYQDADHDVWLEINAYPTEESLGVFYHDITARKQVEEALRVHAEEIERLNARLQKSMIETHHRVKNNLQMVSALIDMQRAGGEETVPMAELARLGTNVLALGVIHDILTQEAKAGSDQEMLSVKAVLERLVRVLEHTMGDRPLKSAFEEARLICKQATTLALVTNELVSNALKHGSGTTEVYFRVHGATATLEVCDDGPGFPAGFNAETESNTGLELVENIVRLDLRGQIVYANRPEGGARVTIVFPITAKQE